jgi:predicted dithiol-disulfide oxidoreductase (DUF899 family)
MTDKTTRTREGRTRKGAAEHHPVVPHKEWLAARIEHLKAEKEFTRLRDQLSQQRRDLPWEGVEKEYAFHGAKGRQTLGELFDGRSQLVVYHAMFDPANAASDTPWTEDAACAACSFWIDNFVNVIVHLNQRDVTLVAASRAPYRTIAAYMERMGWSFNWVSSGDSDFNFDYGVSFKPIDIEQDNDVYYNYRSEPNFASEREGLSVFFRDDDDKIFHTYSAYARGIDMVNAAYHYLDLVPKGRDESVVGKLGWVQRHDEY